MHEIWFQLFKSKEKEELKINYKIVIMLILEDISFRNLAYFFHSNHIFDYAKAVYVYFLKDLYKRNLCKILKELLSIINIIIIL